MPTISTQSQTLLSPNGESGDSVPGALAGYAPPSSTFDEIRSDPRQLRPNWKEFFESIPDPSGEEFARRWRDAEHTIRENGVTYNVYGDPKGQARPWQLDPLPVLIPPDEAAFLENGLIQRAKLLELLFDDLYGEQRVLRDKLLPPELVLANPAFLRPCHGTRPAFSRSLHLYGANLGRSREGLWHVIGDRTQAPSGAGYTLENRIIVGRTLPEAFRSLRVQRLARFFQTLIDELRKQATRNVDNPRIVLLTPGPHNETYFEHSYLARYLGITLVQGGDLTVRDNCVYLKVLGGLQRVDVIFRRVDDEFCDPLELRPDTVLGIPGLLQAVRAGNVTVANALGTGVLETPGLFGYLPRLCRELTGQELAIPSPRTYWCGDPDQLAYVTANLGSLIIKPAFLGSKIDTFDPGMLSREARDQLVASIRAKPHQFVGQQKLPLSTVPVVHGGRIASRHMVFRTYLAGVDGGFRMMPGGLTRVGTTSDELAISMQRGGGSKDTWVLSAGPVSSFSMLPPSDAPVALNRGGGELPSRVADNLFWLGRYAERAESTCRTLRGILGRLAERSDGMEMPALLRAIGSPAGVVGNPTPEIGFASLFEAEDELMSLIFDPQREHSVAAVATHLHGLAQTLRDRISADMWRVVNGIRFPSSTDRTAARLRADQPTTGDALDILDRTIIQLAAFGGLAAESMTRTDGWRFLDLGRKLERALHLISLIQGALVLPAKPEAPVLDAVLDIADSRITYRRRYLSALRIEPVLDLLLFDESNPRSLMSQIRAFKDDIDNLPRADNLVGKSVEQRLAANVLNTVETTDVDELSREAHGNRASLAALMKRLGEMLPQLSEVLTVHYLSHLQMPQHLSPDGGAPA
jgi:uncharacterized circularly permuted ATP-grasp superfamily protein/uncharacterized alpha-E superfamily protein